MPSFQTILNAAGRLPGIRYGEVQGPPQQVNLPKGDKTFGKPDKGKQGPKSMLIYPDGTRVAETPQEVLVKPKDTVRHPSGDTISFYRFPKNPRLSGQNVPQGIFGGGQTTKGEIYPIVVPLDNQS